MKESTLLKQLMSALSNAGVTIFRNQVGQGWYGHARIRLKRGGCPHVEIEDARPLKAGLCPGSSDLIGWQSVEITPEMVGARIAQVVAVEAKTENVRLTEAQRNFLEQVYAAGGVAVEAYSLLDVDGWIGNPTVRERLKAENAALETRLRPSCDFEHLVDAFSSAAIESEAVEFGGVANDEPLKRAVRLRRAILDDEAALRAKLVEAEKENAELQRVIDDILKKGSVDLVEQIRALQDRLAASEKARKRLERLAAFFRSVIQSGESWTDTCEREYAETILNESEEAGDGDD